MATEKDVLLFEVILDIPQVKEKAELARVAIAQLRREKAATEKEFKDKSIGVAEYAKSIEAIDTQLTRAQGQLKGYQKTLADNEKATKSAAGSNDQLRAQLALLVPQYNAMGRNQRQTSVEGQLLTAQVKALTDELKNNEEAAGDNRRSVGDYAKGLRIAGISVGEVQEAVKGGYQAFQVFTKGINLSKGALIALGAIPILLLLAGLVALLTRSQAGMDKLAQFTKAADLAITSLTQGFVRVGEAVVSFFSAETFSSFDKLKAKAQGVADALRGVSSGMADAARAGIDIEKTNQQIEASEISLSVARAKNGAQIERLKLLAQDVSKSNAVRAGAAQKAYDLENSTLKQTLALQQRRIDNAQREFNLSGKTRADARKVAEEQTKYSDLEKESLTKQTELNNNLNTIRQDGIAKAKEAAALASAEEIAHYERLVILAKQKGQDTLLLEEALIKKRAAAELAGDKIGAEKRKLIEVQANAEILALRVNHALEIQKQTLAVQQSQIASSLAVARRGSAEVRDLQIRELRRQTQEQIIELEASYKKKEVTAEQYEERLADLQNTSNRAIDDVRIQFDQTEINRTTELNRLRIETDLDLSDELITMRRNRATDLIAIEEKQQLDLLKLQEITDEERLVRENAIQARAEAQRKEVYRQIQADRRADNRAVIETNLADSRAGSKQELELQKKLLAAQLQEELANRELSEKQKAAIIAKYRRQEKELQESFNRSVISNTLDSAAESAGVLGKIFEAQANQANRILEQQQSAALASAGLSAAARTKIEEKFANRKEELDRKSAERRRKIATIENIIATARAVTEAQILPPPFDIIKTVLAIATGAAQQAVIASQQFARGGEIDGPSHAQGGVKYRVGNRTVELEGGEGVINKHAMRIPAVRQKASELNQMAGNGVAFPGTARIYSQALPRYNPNRLELGGIVSGASGGSVAIDYDKLTNSFLNAVKQLPNPIVGVGAIRDGIGKEVRVESNADIKV